MNKEPNVEPDYKMNKSFDTYIYIFQLMFIVIYCEPDSLYH